VFRAAAFVGCVHVEGLEDGGMPLRRIERVAYCRVMSNDRMAVVVVKEFLKEIEQHLKRSTPLPENRTPRCLELLTAVQTILDELRDKL
jgi:hypothetical protein